MGGWSSKQEFPSSKYPNLLTLTLLQVNHTPQMNLFLVVASWPIN